MKLDRIFIFITLTTVFVVGCILVSMHFLRLFTTASATAFVLPFFYFDKYVVELGIFLLITMWFLYQEGRSRWISYILIILFLCIQIGQVISIAYGGEFIPTIAFENTSFIFLVVNPATITVLVFTVLSLLGVIYFFEKKLVTKPSLKSMVRISVGIVVLTIIVACDSLWLPARPQEKIDLFFSESLLTHSSPVVSFVETLLDQKLDTHNLREHKVSFSASELEQLAAYGLAYNNASDYPFAKDFFYDSSKPNLIKVPKRSEQPNVIVFFVEGFSARTVGAYNPEFKDLTPRIDSFANANLKVTHYYNHTAATNRGLRGQFCSIYPYSESLKFTNLCLDTILKQGGYETYFATSENEATTNLDQMMRELGFDHVLTSEDFLHYVNGKRSRSDALSDTQFFNVLDQWIPTLEQNDKPFFLGVYNLGTHAFIDVANDEQKYGDGSNHTLNTIHNFDRAFGQFWDSFRKSSLAQNTIVIVTADHAHYAETSYQEIIKDPNYQKLFIDQVPFIIYDPLIKYPRTFDAHDATSINFAPTLLHYLGFKQQKNAFLGTSIFSAGRDVQKGGIAGYESNYYLVRNNHIYSSHKSEGDDSELRLITKYLKAVYQAEIHEKIWNTSQLK